MAVDHALDPILHLHFKYTLRGQIPLLSLNLHSAANAGSPEVHQRPSWRTGYFSGRTGTVVDWTPGATGTTMWHVESCIPRVLLKPWLYIPIDFPSTARHETKRGRHFSSLQCQPHVKHRL